MDVVFLLLFSLLCPLSSHVRGHRFRLRDYQGARFYGLLLNIGAAKGFLSFFKSFRDQYLRHWVSVRALVDGSYLWLDSRSPGPEEMNAAELEAKVNATLQKNSEVLVAIEDE
jgi:hypothetical protein